MFEFAYAWCFIETLSSRQAPTPNEAHDKRKVISSLKKTYFIERCANPKWSGMKFLFDVPAEGEIRQQLVSSGINVHEHADSKSALNSLSTLHLPLPVALRVRSVRRCLKELDAG